MKIENKHKGKVLKMQYEGWEGFKSGAWENEVNVRDFIQNNYTPYEGDGAFLAPATENTKKLWAIVTDLSAKERAAGATPIRRSFRRLLRTERGISIKTSNRS